MIHSETPSHIYTQHKICKSYTPHPERCQCLLHFIPPSVHWDLQSTSEFKSFWLSTVLSTLVRNICPDNSFIHWKWPICHINSDMNVLFNIHWLVSKLCTVHTLCTSKLQWILMKPQSSLHYLFQWSRGSLYVACLLSTDICYECTPVKERSKEPNIILDLSFKLLSCGDPYKKVSWTP